MRRVLVTIIAGIVISLSAFATVHAGDIAVQLQIPIPGLGQSLPVCATKGSELECTGIAQYIAFMYRWLVGIAAVLAVLALTWGGVRWLTSAGESGAIEDAKKIMGNAIIGLLIAFCSYTLLWAINPELVQFNPIRLTLIQQIDLDLKSIEEKGEETGDGEDKDEEEELEFVFRDNEKTFAHYQLPAQAARFLFSVTPAHAAKRKKQVKASGSLASLDSYITNNTQFGIVPNRCLKWTRLSLESILKTEKIKNTALYPREDVPALTAKHFDENGAYIRSKSLSGINNGDVVFMRTSGSFLVTSKRDHGPGGDSISHIGIYYNGSIYHQFASKLYKDVAKSGVLKGRLARDGTPVVIIGYGKLGL